MTTLELCLFATTPEDAGAAASAGVDALIVDWEHSGKHDRQQDADTEINAQTVDDLAAVAAASMAPVICRVDGVDPEGAAAAIGAGASEVLVPMVRARRDVERVLEAVGEGRVGILVETNEAVRRARELADLPLTRVYVGLNDLAIERRSASIFDAVADGTVERLREAFECRFGFGGATVPSAGEPIPARLLISEMVRLDCSFTFLRRSYRRDVADAGGHAAALAAIRSFAERAERRPAAERDADRLALHGVIEDLGRRVPSG